MKLSKISGYSISFLWVLIILKISYLLVESAYNTVVLDANVLTNPTQEIFNNIEILGHAVASIGITILLLPFLYRKISRLLKRKYILVKRFFLIGISSILVCFTAYFSLEKLMDIVVNMNQEKRHEAYYLNILKYGISNKILAYKDIIEIKGSQQPFTLEEKIILNNIFLTLFLDDKKLINKIQTKGMSNIIAFIKSNKSKEDFREKNNQYIKAAHKLRDSYNKYNKGREQAQEKYRKYIQNSQAAYIEFQDEIKLIFTNYLKSVEKYKDEIDKRIKTVGSSSFRAKWNDFAKYYNKGGYYRKKALEQYRENVTRHFGHYIEPNDWCVSSWYKRDECMSDEGIKNVVTKEANRKWFQRTLVPQTLYTFDQFVNNKYVQVKIRKELAKKGLVYANMFDYSYASFKKAYVNKIENQIKRKFTREIFRKTGIENLPINLNFKSFVFNENVKKEISKELNYKVIPYLNTMLKLIIENRMGEFFRKVYEPMLNKTLEEELIPTKESFKWGEHQKAGDQALKALYIPPVSILFSLLFGILNLISLISLVLAIIVFYLTNHQEKLAKNTRRITSIILLFIVLLIPYYRFDSEYENRYKRLHASVINSNSLFAQIYFKSFKWVMTVEKYNYDIGVTLRNTVSKKILNKYGLIPTKSL